MKYGVIIAVAGVALAGFVYMVFWHTPARELASDSAALMEEAATEKVVVEEAATTRQGTGSLESLRLLGENLECSITYTDVEQQTTVSGTYFVSGGDMRGDFLTDSPDLSGQVLSSMIINDTTMYVWSEIEGETYGIQFDTAQFADAEAPMDTNEPVALDAAVQYDCKLWPNVDRTVFDPPATVLFQDLGELMQGGMEYGTVYEGYELPEGFEMPQMQ